jgi:uncharacterized YccA/Bax inhibitor family protein
MRTGNPALNSSTFDTFEGYAVERSDAMTLQGTANKTGMLLILLAASAGFSWIQLRQAGQVGGLPAVMPYFVGGLAGSLIAGIALWFKREWAAILAPVYAVSEGLVLGIISAAYEAQFQGIVFQAVCLTFGTLFSLLTAYRTGLIKPSENFKLGLFAATGAVALLYLVNAIMFFCGMQGVPFLHGSSLMAIGINAVIVVIAALNLVLDFDFIEEGVKHGAPKYMEWYAGYGLLVTLVWLYLEILRLLAKLNDRD